MAKTRLGTLTVAGLGAGLPGQLALRAAEALRAADTIVIDAWVHPGVAAMARAEADWVNVGPHGGRPALEPAEVRQLLAGRVKGGKRVVRLVAGHPLLFSTAAEEIAALERDGLPVEIVPGVGALSAAAAFGGAPLHDASGRSPIALVWGPTVDAAEWASFLKEGGLLVIFDPLPKLSRIVKDLVDAGLPAGLPSVAISQAGTGAQRRVAAGLDALVGAVEQAEVPNPAIVLLGQPVKERRLLDSFQERPLQGRRIVLTRTREQAGEWRGQLEALGAEVLELPLIRVTIGAEPQAIADAFVELGSYDWLVFTSANGVRGFFHSFFRAYKDIRSLGFVRVAVVGEGTAAALAEFRIEPELMPEKQDAVALAEALIKTGSLDSAKILLVTGNLNRDELAKQLEEARAIVDRFQVYRTEPGDLRHEPAAVEFRARGADAIVFTSSSAVRSFVDQAGSLALEPGAKRPIAVSIGPMTSATLREFRLPVDVEAAAPNVDSLVAGLLRKLED